MKHDPYPNVCTMYIHIVPALGQDIHRQKCEDNFPFVPGSTKLRSVLQTTVSVKYLQITHPRSSTCAFSFFMVTILEQTILCAYLEQSWTYDHMNVQYSISKT